MLLVEAELGLVPGRLDAEDHSDGGGVLGVEEAPLHPELSPTPGLVAGVDGGPMLCSQAVVEPPVLPAPPPPPGLTPPYTPLNPEVVLWEFDNDHLRGLVQAHLEGPLGEVGGGLDDGQAGVEVGTDTVEGGRCGRKGETVFKIEVVSNFLDHVFRECVHGDGLDLLTGFYKM